MIAGRAMQTPNPVEDAIEALGGQVEDLAVVCRVTSAAVYKWIQRGRILDVQHAIMIARATAERGHPISIERLAGFAVPTGPQGGDANDVLAGRRRQAVAPRSVTRDKEATPPSARSGSRLSARRRRRDKISPCNRAVTCLRTGTDG